LVGEEGEVVILLEDHPGDHRKMEKHGDGEATLVVEEGGILGYHGLGEVVCHPLEVGRLGIFVGHHPVLGPSIISSAIWSYERTNLSKPIIP
jgi:hypothetical protein